MNRLAICITVIACLFSSDFAHAKKTAQASTHGGGHELRIYKSEIQHKVRGTAYGSVSKETGNKTAKPVAIAAVGLKYDLHVVVVDKNGAAWHCARLRDGKWTAMGNISSEIEMPEKFDNVRTSRRGRALVVKLYCKGELARELIRHEDGVWTDA